MAQEATITAEVTTGDAVPIVAPHRISARPGKDNASVYLLITRVVGTHALGWWRLVKGGLGRSTGTVVTEQGTLCGVSRCGRTRPMRVADDWVLHEDLTYAEVNDGGADGGRSYNAFAVEEA